MPAILLALVSYVWASALVTHGPQEPPEGRPAAQNLHSEPIPLPPEFFLEGRAAEVRQVIVDEVASLQAHAWAGRYYMGNGLGMNISLVIAPESGFLWHWTGCLGSYGLNHGTVAVDADGRIVLQPVKSKKEQGIGIGQVYWPVQWGEHRLLVPRGGEHVFAKRVRAGLSAWYLLRASAFVELEKERPPRGVPIVPPAMADLLEPDVVEATITEVRESEIVRDGYRIRRTEVRLDKGRDAGFSSGWLLSKQTILFPSEPSLFERLLITGAGPNTATGVVEQVLNAGEDRPMPEVGWRVTTRWPSQQSAQADESD